MMDWYGGHMGGGGWALMVLVVVVVAVALIMGVLALLGRRDAPPGAPAAGSTPERVLAERFARGEIEEAEYAGRLSTLREQRGS